MIGIVFFFQDPQTNFFSGIMDTVIDRIIFNARNLGATHVFMIDKTQYKIGQYYQHSDSQIAFQRFESLEELEKTYPKVKFIYFENARALEKAGIESYTLLPDFAHPSRAIYVVGTETGGIPISGREDKIWVSIPVENLWAEGAINICLYDRLTKLRK